MSRFRRYENLTLRALLLSVCRTTSTVTIRLTEKKTEWLRRFRGLTLSDTIRALIKYDMENNLLNYNFVKSVHDEKKTNRKYKAKIAGVLDNKAELPPQTLLQPVSQPTPYVPMSDKKTPVQSRSTQPQPKQSQKQTEIPAFFC